MAILLATGPLHAATPDAELNACVDKYISANGGKFDCSVCGISAGCSGNDCHWGALGASAANDAALSAMMTSGYQLYCLNAGGSMVASASPVAAQTGAIDRALRGAGRSGNGRQLGGAVEYGSRSGGSSSYGVAAPFSFTRRIGDGSKDFDIAGTALFGHTSELSQYGVNAAPMLRFFPSSEGRPNRVFGLSLPVQLIMTTGSAINTSFVYHAGLGAIAGYSSEGAWGVGAAVDGIYAGGIQVPVQVVGRVATTISGADFVVQPGISANASAGGSIADTLQQNVLVGWDIGAWIVGLRVFRQGDKAWVFSLGAAESSKASRLAAGTDNAYDRAPPSPGKTPAHALPTPAGALPKVLVLAELTDDLEGGARLVSSIGEGLAADGFAPLPPADKAKAVGAATASVASDGAVLDGLRASAASIVAVSVVAAPTPEGSVRVSITVAGRGLLARRMLTVERQDLETKTRQALRELFSKIDFRTLRDAPQPVGVVVPPVPVPNPGAPTPAPLTPPSTPPAGGCSKDTECKGDRVCQDGRCVNP